MMYTKINGFDVYTITSADNNTKASFVPEKGGVGSSITMPDRNQERELLFRHLHFWERNNPNLPGGWPFLFPVCARLERHNVVGDYLYDGKIYNLPIHGFAPYLPWEVSAHTTDTLTMKLCATPKTLAMYPFNFCVELTYKAANKIFTCAQRYTNTGEKPLPYYAGFHPYFLTPSAINGKEKVRVDFKATRHFKCNEKLTDLVGDQELLALPASIADPKINEQLSLLGENKITTLSYPDGLKINMKAAGVEDPNLFNYLQLYTQLEEPFICLEPWMAFPNALNTIQGVRWLKPNQSEHGILKLWIERA